MSLFLTTLSLSLTLTLSLFSTIHSLITLCHYFSLLSLSLSLSLSHSLTLFYHSLSYNSVSLFLTTLSLSLTLTLSLFSTIHSLITLCHYFSLLSLSLTLFYHSLSYNSVSLFLTTLSLTLTLSHSFLTLSLLYLNLLSRPPPPPPSLSLSLSLLFLTFGKACFTYRRFSLDPPIQGKASVVYAAAFHCTRTVLLVFLLFLFLPARLRSLSAALQNGAWKSQNELKRNNTPLVQDNFEPLYKCIYHEKHRNGLHFKASCFRQRGFT